MTAARHLSVPSFDFEVFLEVTHLLLRDSCKMTKMI